MNITKSKITTGKNVIKLILSKHRVWTLARLLTPHCGTWWHDPHATGNPQKVQRPQTYCFQSPNLLDSSSRSCYSPTILLLCLHNQRQLSNFHTIYPLWRRLRSMLLFRNWRNLLARLYASLNRPRYALAKTIDHINRLVLRVSFTSYRYLRKTKRHTNDLSTSQASLSLPFGVRLRRRRIQIIAYLMKC